MLVTIATFDHKADNAPKVGVTSWTNLRKKLSKHVQRDEKDEALWSPAEFRAGGKRQKSDVVTVCCFVLDIDGGLDPSDFCAQWDSLNLTYVLHSTHSSTPDHPKWRAVFPLEDPVDASEWPTVWEKLNEHLGLGLGDSACRDASRMYYLPATPPGVEPFVFTHDGEMLDPDGFADLPKTDPERARLNGSGRPGDDYEMRVDWHELMSAMGFHSPRRYGKMTVWTRAGKTHGNSARTGDGTHGDRMYCWSSSVDGVMPGKLYTKFGLYATLYHGGDYKAAAAALGKLGYGQQVQTKTGMPRDWGSSDKTIGEMKAEDRAKKFAGIRSINSYEPEEIRFLVDPYIRLGQINLLDAKGGSGKTTLGMALAACGSNGVTPISGEPCAPWKTLYFHTEDSPSEMKKVYDECGGNPDGDCLIPYTEPLELDDNGIDYLSEIVDHFKPKLVVFDAITYYLPARIKAAFDNIAISRVLNGLREVMRTHSAACLDVRHFKQGRQGLAIEDWGTGGEAWRNSHRSQLVMVPSLKRKRTSGIFHTKGSLVSATGAPFGFTFEGGEFGWLQDIDPAEFGVDDERFAGKSVERGERGPMPIKMQAAVDAIIAILKDGPVPYGHAKDAVLKRADCAERSMREAAKLLKVVYDPTQKTWALPSSFDPFEHPGINPTGGEKWWAS